MKSPLEQFKINEIYKIRTEWVDLTITNTTIYLIIGALILILNGRIITNKIIKRSYENINILGYRGIENMVKEIIPKEYKKYVTVIMALMMIILINNMIGLIPYSYTTTAQIIVTVTLSLSIIIGVTIIGILKHKIDFIKLFKPAGLENMKVMIPIIFTIEVISYLIRIISLSVRLSANLISGHTLLKIISNFGLKYTIGTPILLIIPISLIFGIYLLELGVGIIQAYVFTLLTITYIKDVELLH